MNMEHVTVAGDEAKLTLRVLSGPNRGAETSLDEGVWLIGTSATDDLTFADPELAATHLRIAVEAGRIHIIALAPGVRIGAKDLPIDKWTVLDPLTPVQVGRTIFGIGPAGSSFPELDFVVGSRESDTSAHLSVRPELTSVLVGRQISLMVGSTSRRLRLGAVACALLITPVVFWAAKGRVPPSASEAAPTADTMRTARDIIRDLNVVPDFNVTLIDDKLIIEGDVGPEEHSEVKAALRNAGLEAKVLFKRPLSDSQLISLVTTVIRSFGIRGSVRLNGAGEVTVTGYAPSDAKATEALHRLRQDIPGLSEVEDAIATPERARIFLETAMTDHLRRSIHILTKSGGLFVSGRLTPLAFEAWQTVASRFQEKFGPYIPLETQFTPVTLPPPRGVNLGRTPYVVVENGTRLKIGDRLEASGQILAIDRGGISVRIGADEVHVPYPSKPRWIAEEGW
ncbi:type III secretion system inner membrane ring subunit SctD [Rhizobium gallicum]|uniref:type III secretion system inner membrane ring subunit SctD n=1 Tax=Rhizobium gallicum TaxID=56730 RepID=UPI001EF85A43|nr:type III secretion system inner membrane ring subunit SctD [Rhizobium gallicum]ULJ74560.1 type III secretion system inner membrane ring subunit SctD [Rhizobium gallicum]